MSEEPALSTFDAFYRDHYVATVRLAAFLAGSRVLAEDLAQEAFLRIQPRFDSLDRPLAYLRTTLVNTCRNQHRGEQREVLRLVRHGAEAAEVSQRAAVGWASRPNVGAEPRRTERLARRCQDSDRISGRSPDRDADRQGASAARRNALSSSLSRLRPVGVACQRIARKASGSVAMPVTVP